MSAFPDGFNPSIDRYDRRSAAHLFRWLWPETDVSLACAQALAVSVRVAHEAADASWEVSMFAHAVRLNVGQVEALTLTADSASFLFRAPLSSKDASPGEIEINNDPYYPAVPVSSGVCIIAADDLPSLSAAVREAHNAYIRAAASFKRGSPFRNSFSPAVLEYLEEVLRESLPRPGYFPQQAATPRVDPLPDELDASLPLWEGAKYLVTVNAYERNPVSRCRCIAHYGPTCVICGFNFGAVYGPLAEGFMHVHHIKPLSEIGKKYKVDPVADLRPVCPNCHGVVHLGGGCRSIDEVRQLLSLDRERGCGPLMPQ
jgi:5-methylcytosine-specific restriction enzyme A